MLVTAKLIKNTKGISLQATALAILHITVFSVTLCDINYFSQKIFDSSSCNFRQYTEFSCSGIEHSFCMPLLTS